jgi:hypothetical protein
MSVDFQRKLAEQLDFIRASAQAYDQGKTHEAVRIATSLRVLFHDTDNSKSLCRHLGKSHLMLASTMERDPGTGDMFLGLIGMKAQFPITISKVQGGLKIEMKQGDGLMRCHPLGANMKWFFVNYDQWWRKQVVFRNRSLNACRRDVILSAANKDGGAHVDAKYDAKYDAIAKGFGMQMLMYVNKTPMGAPTPDDPDALAAKLTDPHLAAIRQMANEVLASPDIIGG